MSLAPEDVSHWQQWVGNREISTECIDTVRLDRYAAAIGEVREPDRVPSLGHWAFFVAAVPPEKIGSDGHPDRGGFLPPVTLERRMFAASDIHFHAPLRENIKATRTAELVSLVHKTGKSGDLLLAEVLYRVEQEAGLLIEERQTIVYRDGGAPTPPVEPASFELGERARSWEPSTVDLFRFSAVTFNSHRIHYDLPYATNVENYPGLVVHGPFTAAKLFGYAQEESDAPIRRFRFRAQLPIFAGQPVTLCPGENEGAVVARRCDGALAMTASFET